MSAQANRCREDLFARSRRAPLSAVERRALDAHLAVCDLCRAAGAFAAVYDAIPDHASAADDLLIARLADRVAGRTSAVRPGRAGRIPAIAAGIALLIAAGGAAAWVVRILPSRAPDAGVAPRPESPKLRPIIEAVPASPPLQPRDDEKPAPGEKTTPRHVGGGERGRSPRASAAPAAPTAAELFAEANAARRALDLRRATDLYLALDRRYPESAEAPVALVSAGDLLSRLGEPAGALQAFERYLDGRPDGALAPEALFGRARAFRQLGRPQDEIVAWRRLLRAFPGSVYESAGRQRLGELQR